MTSENDTIFAAAGVVIDDLRFASLYFVLPVLEKPIIFIWYSLLIASIFLLPGTVFRLDALLWCIHYFIWVSFLTTLRWARVNEAILNGLLCLLVLSIRVNHPLMKEELGARAVDLVSLEVHVWHLLEWLLLSTIPLLVVAAENRCAGWHHHTPRTIADWVLLDRWLLNRVICLSLTAQKTVTLGQTHLSVIIAVTVSVCGSRSLSLWRVESACRCGFGGWLLGSILDITLAELPLARQLVDWTCWHTPTSGCRNICLLRANATISTIFLQLTKLAKLVWLQT